jgi:DNA-binding beta-propeller fold protein YncE
VNRREFLALSAAVPFAAARPSNRLLLAPNAVALVTADDEARIAVVDVVSGRVLRSIAVIPGPRSIEATAGDALAVAAHWASGAVSILDAHGVRRVLHDFAEPRYTAAHPSGEHVYVTDSADSEVVAVDVARGRTLGRVRVGGWARHITIDAAGRTLWVGLGTASERVAVVDVSDPARPRLARHVRPPFRAHDVGFVPGGRTVWVTSGDARGIAVYDARTHEVLRRLPAGAPPQHVTFGDGVAYVTSGNDGTFSVLSLRDGRVLRTTAIPRGSFNVQHGHGRVLTASLDTGALTVLGANGGLFASAHVAASTHDACFVRR